MIPDFHINRTWFLHFLLYFIFFKYVSSFYFLFPIPVIKCYQFFFSAIPIHISQTSPLTDLCSLQQFSLITFYNDLLTSVISKL